MCTADVGWITGHSCKEKLGLFDEKLNIVV
jgi:hypothetical protein